MNNLGQMYLHGLIGPRDPLEAFRWHLAAAKLGNYAASVNVSLAYRSGDGVARDEREARRWAQWTDPGNENAGIGEPTLARTGVFGAVIPPERRALVRAAAEQKVPVTLEFKPLRPDPRLPTFRQVQERLGN
jgi:hypothetical protein